MPGATCSLLLLLVVMPFVPSFFLMCKGTAVRSPCAARAAFGRELPPFAGTSGRHPMRGWLRPSWRRRRHHQTERRPWSSTTTCMVCHVLVLPVQIYRDFGKTFRLPEVSWFGVLGKFAGLRLLRILNVHGTTPMEVSLLLVGPDQHNRMVSELLALPLYPHGRESNNPSCCRVCAPVHGRLATSLGAADAL